MADDLHSWAHTVPITPSRQCGEMRARLVLLRLADYADVDGIAWPSAETLAAGMAGMSRWSVREALTVLAASGAITRAGKQGRSMRWQLAGHPAGFRAVKWQGTLPSEVAGNVAGQVAGNLAGHPAPNRSEGNLRVRAREECPTCDDHGMLLDPDSRLPIARCDHHELAVS